MADTALSTIEARAAQLHEAENKGAFRLVRACDMEFKAPSWLVRGVLESDSTALVFGDPAAGKSLLALEIGASLSVGCAFHGHEVKQSPVIYIAGEGGNGLRRRTRAWEIARGHSLEGAPLFMSTKATALTDMEEAEAVVTEVDAVAREHGSPGLVVVDTVARNFGAGDENSTQDMGAFIAAADRIRARYACTVLLVHHTGHGDKSRARGAMALKGALDAEYRLEKDDDGTVRMTATKMKDAAEPEPLAFRIAEVELDLVDDRGEPVTSAVLDRIDFCRPATQRRGKWQCLALEKLRALGGTGEEVSLDTWRRACLDDGMPRQRWHEVRDSLTPFDVSIKDGLACLAA
ncbi:AAA family ATPase [Algiphilus aromaticivorans]|uniref:AAA family ATPase n=1 Tax=Algiphilus aromaticivorans TaxID=382454 RepID=UPI0009FF8D0C|nr:AAA family ATPase [Algiphilus aromaticivorans]